MASADGAAIFAKVKGTSSLIFSGPASFFPHTTQAQGTSSLGGSAYL